MKPGLAEMKNAVVVPHIASASKVLVAFHYNFNLYINYSDILFSRSCVLCAVDSRRDGDTSCFECSGMKRGKYTCPHAFFNAVCCCHLHLLHAAGKN